MTVITASAGAGTRGLDLRLLFPSLSGLAFTSGPAAANAFTIRTAPEPVSGLVHQIRYGDIAGARPPTTNPPVPSGGLVTSIHLWVEEGGALVPLASAIGAAGPGITAGNFNVLNWNAGPGSAAFANIANIFLGGADTITGGGGNDNLFGLRGRDVIAGGGGNDTVAGGDGDDTLSGNAGDNTLDGGFGFDTADYGWATAALAITVGTGARGAGPGAASGWGGTDLLLGVEHARGGAGNDAVTGSAGINLLAGGGGGDTLRGLGHNDTLQGDAGDDVLRGGQGADLLDGGEGDDQLWGRDTAAETGVDTLVGGPGSDTARFDWAATGSIAVSLAAGEARLPSGLLATGFAGVENVRVGDAAAALTGRDAEANTLVSGAGNDTLLGLGGDDWLAAGTGFNTLDGGAGSDTADYTGAAGAVTAQLWLGAAFASGSTLDTLISVENARGGAFADALTGGAGANRLEGGGGDDRLLGLAGDDVLLGGEGDDALFGGEGQNRMEGGAGRNNLRVDGAADVVVVAPGAVDQAFVAVDGWAAAPGLFAAYLIDGARALLGGEAWADTLAANLALGSLLEGRGGDDTLWGRGLADTLLGGEGRDVLRGGGGDDTLAGGAGDDQLEGGAGADRFVFDRADWGFDQLFGYARDEGDVLDFRGSGLASAAELGVHSDGVNLALFAPDGSRLDVYGVSDLSQVVLVF